MRRALRLRDEFTWLEPPADLGELTILDVAKARDSAEHADAVKRWASSVWRAWTPYHTTILEWI